MLNYIECRIRPSSRQRLDVRDARPERKEVDSSDNLTVMAQAADLYCSEAFKGTLREIKRQIRRAANRHCSAQGGKST